MDTVAIEDLVRVVTAGTLREVSIENGYAGCEELKVFREVWPEGAEITMVNIYRARLYNLSISWLGFFLPPDGPNSCREWALSCVRQATELSELHEIPLVQEALSAAESAVQQSVLGDKEIAEGLAKLMLRYEFHHHYKTYWSKWYVLNSLCIILRAEGIAFMVGACHASLLAIRMGGHSTDVEPLLRAQYEKLVELLHLV